MIFAELQDFMQMEGKFLISQGNWTLDSRKMPIILLVKIASS